MESRCVVESYLYIVNNFEWIFVIITGSMGLEAVKPFNQVEID